MGQIVVVVRRHAAVRRPAGAATIEACPVIKMMVLNQARAARLGGYGYGYGQGYGYGYGSADAARRLRPVGRGRSASRPPAVPG